MTELEKSHLLVINQLLDHALFTHSLNPDMRQLEKHAHEVYQTPLGRKRINSWFNRVFGIVPTEFHGNWLWQIGPNRLPVQEVTVLLAAMKAIINSPATKGLEADSVIEARPIIESVRSVNDEVSEKEIAKIIHELLVDRYQLLKPDNLEVESEHSTTVDEYWDVAPDFVPVAQLLVQSMKKSLSATENNIPTATQRVNQYLLKFRYMSNKSPLWSKLTENKMEIAEMWRPLRRFYLEVGDDYALLLDGNRRQQRSRAYFVALGVSHSLGAGMPDVDLGAQIRLMARQLYPDATVNQSFVKDALTDSALARCINGFWVATPIAQRFNYTLEDNSNEH